ncbi:MAG: iron ABC transporter permease [Desulfobulbaceae bacterium]|jgi:iron complex transport system permease protein|nr:iron ABC transporter permease [Desulfobulbaceae bacterium]
MCASHRSFFLALVALLAISLAVSIWLGFMAVTPWQIMQAIAARLGLATETPTIATVVILDVRLPRILAAALVGGGLALAGGVFQALLLNPLADPYTLGISSGAAFGASLAIALSLIGLSFPGAIPLCAFLGALATLAVVFSLAGHDRAFSSNTLILSGIIIAAILSAGIGFIQYLADREVAAIVFWLMGSLVGRSWADVGVLALLSLPASLIIFYHARDLNVMALGNATADSLGVDTVRTRKLLLISASLMTAASVAVAGIIGFVGLLVPHLLRSVLGPDNRLLLPASFLTGAILLLAADTLTRAVLPHELPIGILTALIGGPFFCLIFKRQQMRNSR